MNSVAGRFVSSNKVDPFTVAIRDLDAPGNNLDLGVFTLFEVTTAGPVTNPFRKSVLADDRSPSDREYM